MNLISVNSNKEVVNLDLVTYVYPTPEDKVIYFMFASMNQEEIQEVKWVLDSEEQFERVMKYLSTYTVHI